MGEDAEFMHVLGAEPGGFALFQSCEAAAVDVTGIHELRFGDSQGITDCFDISSQVIVFFFGCHNELIDDYKT